MSNNQEQDLKARLKELEEELKQKQAASQEKVETVYGEIETDSEEEAELIATIYSWLSMARDKFNNLAPAGKLVVGVAALWFGVTALNLALHLISSLITVAILGVVLYFAYQKLIVNN